MELYSSIKQKKVVMSMKIQKKRRSGVGPLRSHVLCSTGEPNSTITLTYSFAMKRPWLLSKQTQSYDSYLETFINVKFVDNYLQ